VAAAIAAGSLDAMHTFRRLTPSGSMIVAVIALVVAMSGSAVAASLITTTQIKNGTIQTKDISKKARSALTGKPGPAGHAGPKGDAGAPGLPGKDGTNGVTNVAVRKGETVILAHATGIAFAHCNPGEKAIGGGGQFLVTNTGAEWIQRTGPANGTQVAAEGSTPDSWFVRGFNNEDTKQTIGAFAVCAS
jgi:hypothetical protein